MNAVRQWAVTRNLGVYLAVICAFYFSYIPFIYCINWLGVGKEKLFVGLLFSCLSIFVVGMLIGNVRTHFSSKLFVLYLYLPFAVYAAVSYSLSIDYLNDRQSVFVLSILNPIFIYLAIISSHKKEVVFKFLYVLAFVYFLFIAVSWSTGSLSTASGFIRVFGVMEESGYQGINTYLGLMVLLVVGFYSSYGKFFKGASIVIAFMSFFFMLLIGGRASIAAVVVVISYWFLLTRNMSLVLKVAMLLSLSAFSVAFVVLTEFDILRVFQDSNLLSVRRLRILMEGGDSSERGFLFSKAIELFTLNVKNLIFGAGMNFFPVYTGSFGTGSYPHNIILELLAEYGLVGFSLFIIPVLYLFHLRKKKLGSIFGYDKIERLSFMLFLYYFIIYMFTGGLRSSWLFIFILFLLYPTGKSRSEVEFSLMRYRN